jgi:hypothetical protein
MMDAGVVGLIFDSGPLVMTRGVPRPGERFEALALEFEKGVLHLSCQDDTDEVLATVGRAFIDYPEVAYAALTDAVGMTAESAWELRNHRGYADGFQIRFLGVDRREVICQFEVGASTIEIRRVDTTHP